MKRSISILGIIFLILPLCFQRTAANASLTSKEREAIVEKVNKLKLPWVKNSGLLDDQVLYHVSLNNGHAYFTKAGQLVYQTVSKESKANQILKPGQNDLMRLAEPTPVRGFVCREKFLNGSVKKVTPEFESPATVSYFLGSDPAKWSVVKSTFYSLHLADVWNNISVKLNCSADNIEKRFYVSPGGRVDDIRMMLEGYDGLKVDRLGSLIVANGRDEMRFSAPVAYQYISGKKADVPIHYVLTSGGYGFEAGDYNKNYTLVIDPVLSLLTASTYVGGGYYDYNNSIDVDGAGNVYVTSGTLSSNFPTTLGAYQTTLNGGGNSQDVQVSKLNSSLTTLLASTYIGGNTSDQSMFVTVSAAGEIFISGQTFSADYPTTPGALQPSYGGGNFDGFISKFNSSLTSLLASTKLGGGGTELPYNLVFDNSDGIYAVGFTTSPNFPVTSGAYKTTIGGSSDVYVTMLDTGLTTIKASTFIGGSSDDYGYRIVRDYAGNLLVTGQTTSSNYPTTAGVFQTSLKGASDTYVSKLNGNLTTLLASTYLGGTGGEQANNIIVDNSGNAYLTGWESSSDFPVTVNATQATYGGGQSDAYISCLKSDLTALLGSTYMGGNTDEYGYGLALDATRNIFVSGFTGGNPMSSTYRTTGGAYKTTYQGGYYDGFISLLSNSLTTLLESTFVGSTNSDFGYYLALSNTGNVYLAGQTQGATFPTTPGAYQPNSAGAADIFICKFGNNLSSPPVAKFIASDTLICQGSNISFTDQSTGSPTGFKWTFTKGNPSTSLTQNPTVRYDTAGIYPVKLVVTNSSGADSLTRTAYIHVIAGPTAGVLSAVPDSVCPGGTSDLQLSGSSGTIRWQYAASGGSYADIDGATGTGYTTTALSQSTSYRVIVDNGACADTSGAAVVVVNPLPTPPTLIAVDKLICSSDSTQITTTGTYASYLWNNGDVRSYTFAKAAGGYWVSVTDANGCSAVSEHKNIAVYAATSISIVVQGDTLSSFNGVTYQWLKSGNIIPGATGQVFVATETGYYSLEIVDANGCTVRSSEVYVLIGGIEDLENQLWSVYPNPAADYVRINISSVNSADRLELFDATGKLIQVYEPKPTQTIPLNNISSGVYHLVLRSKGGVLVKPLVISR